MKLLRIILAAILGVALVASLAACGTPQAQPTSAPTETTQPPTESMATTLPPTTTLLETTTKLPFASTTKRITTTTAAIRRSAVDMSDEAHAIESLRAFYFANRELFNKIKNDLYGVQNYNILQFSVTSTDNSEYICACNEEDGYTYPSPEDLDPGLLKNLRQYFALFEPHDAYYTVFMNRYFLQSEGWVFLVRFEFGYLKSQSDKYIEILYFPALNASSKSHYRLEDDWYIDVKQIVT